MTREKSRVEVKNDLKRLYKKGYRYVVRDKNSSFLLCFSKKPKRYRDMDSWGYKTGEHQSDVLPAYPIKNKDITEINYNNRSATLIVDFIESVG